jgi:nucleoside-diphosphate-sugar epimerase
MEKILVTGGCGYVGSVLTNTLLRKGYEVIVVDTEWFGNYLGDHENLTCYKKDTREISFSDLDGVTKVIHLANIANDPAVDLDQTLSWEVNVLSTLQLIDKCVRTKFVKQFIFASSGSVYGVKDEPKVTEDLPLVPLSAYNKTKMVAERVLKSYEQDIQIHNIRPATVCGLSPRMRLDVAVNLLTFQALSKAKITVLGGEQTRPNIHIKDMVGVYKHFVENSGQLESGEYNAGFENISILEIAEMVKKHIPCEIEIRPTNDPRSYRQDSSKLIRSGFTPNHNVENAILEIKDAYENGSLKESSLNYTIETMKNILNIKNQQTIDV